jgi:general secretion pathway protein I
MTSLVRASRGFTLVEVLVALGVVALALPALLLALSQQIDGSAYLRDKSMAQLVAANRLTEFRLVSASQQALFKGSDSGELEMAGREWNWWLQSTTTEVDEFYRVEISVALDQGSQDKPLYSIIAFMSSDLQVAAQEGDNAPQG